MARGQRARATGARDRRVIARACVALAILCGFQLAFARERETTVETWRRALDVARRGADAAVRYARDARDALDRRARGCGRDGWFCEEALCARTRALTTRELLGQDVGAALVVDAVCDHAEKSSRDREKPLVMSLHGSPGVGKSLFHRILARAAYNATRESDFDSGRRGRRNEACPGAGCPGYKVIFGTDYVVRERETQARMLRDAVTRHLEKYPESVVVVEEYDKLGCPARGMLKQMLEHGSAGTGANPFDRNVTFGRSIFVLEANMGFMDVHDASAAGGGAPTGDELTALQRKLKDGLFEKWTSDGCEDREDTLKVVGAIDIFVPFVPLDRAAVKAIVHAQLERRGETKKARRELARLEWDDRVLEALVNEVEFEGEYAIEGGKEVAIVLSRCVTRALRVLAETEIARAGTDGVGVRARVLRDRVVRLKPSTAPATAPVVAVLA